MRGSHSVTVNDLFYGILHVPATDAARALYRCGITLEKAMARSKPVILPFVMDTPLEPLYTQQTQNIIQRSIAVAFEQRGHKHALPGDLLLAMLESMKGGDEKVDGIFQANADVIQEKMDAIKKEDYTAIMNASRRT